MDHSQYRVQGDSNEEPYYIIKIVRFQLFGAPTIELNIFSFPSATKYTRW